MGSLAEEVSSWDLEPLVGVDRSSISWKPGNKKCLFRQTTPQLCFIQTFKAEPGDSVLKGSQETVESDFLRPIKGLFSVSSPGIKAIQSIWCSERLLLCYDRKNQKGPALYNQGTPTGFKQAIKQALRYQGNLLYQMSSVILPGVWSS